ncbi:MAG: hypothetical protein JWO05_84 [Gemmatimonadetes bacterium]|nr:hypothetical protein [Gemmatimonadota bacterium]
MMPGAEKREVAAAAKETAEALPTGFARSTSDAKLSRTLELRDGMTRANAWRSINDLLGQRFIVDVVDQKAGFVMTTWQASWLRDGVPDLRYRTRLVVRFQGDDGRQLQVRCEAQYQRGDEWDVGTDSTLLDSVAADLRARVGKKA